MNQQQKTTIICYKSTVPAPDAAVSSRQGDLLDEMKEGRRKTRSWKWKKKNVSHSWYPILDFFLPSASLSCRVSYYERPFRGNICYVCLPGVPSLFWKQHSSLCSSSGLYSYTPRRDSMPLDIMNGSGLGSWPKWDHSKSSFRLFGQWDLGGCSPSSKDAKLVRCTSELPAIIMISSSEVVFNQKGLLMTSCELLDQATPEANRLSFSHVNNFSFNLVGFGFLSDALERVPMAILFKQKCFIIMSTFLRESVD